MTETEFEILWQELKPKVRAIAIRHAASVPGFAADDLEQEMAVKLWRACVANEQKIDNLASYLSRIAANAAIDVVRRSKQRSREVLDSETAPEYDLSECVVVTDNRESKDLINQALEVVAALPENRCIAVRLKLQGFSHAEIAELSGWSEDKARNLATRGMHQLREQLKNLGLKR
ncbi:MAG: hypothetical protein DHS20C11_12900 [Lysobacteraceae bacterium]|nr:MAG: hypothetical protein DHS20C11_12900 [Xanthomonadaceae bacterium]